MHRRNLFRGIVVVSALALLAFLLTSPLTGTSDVERRAHTTSLPTATDLGSCLCPPTHQQRGVSEWPCAVPEYAPVCSGSVEQHAIKQEKFVPPLPETPSFEQIARKGAGKVYEFRYGTPAPGCVTTRYMMTAAFYRR